MSCVPSATYIVPTAVYIIIAFTVIGFGGALYFFVKAAK